MPQLYMDDDDLGIRRRGTQRCHVQRESKMYSSNLAVFVQLALLLLPREDDRPAVCSMCAYGLSDGLDVIRKGTCFAAAACG